MRFFVPFPTIKSVSKSVQYY